MLAKRYPYYLANLPVEAKTDLEVFDKYNGKRATRVARADATAVRKAIVAAHRAREAVAAFPPDARRDVLDHCVKRFSERFEELALALCIEAGKPIRDARGEVTRLIDTFRIAAGEATRIGGDGDRNADSRLARRGYRGMVKRVTIVCAASSHRSTFRSTWSRTRWPRPSPRVARSCSNPRRNTDRAH
jgi:acyl-CoA reductase-like NAD-dependent aldehyde dehydrogenase